MAQNWHFWSIWARLIQCPVDGSVGGCGARAVSRKTPIYFINLCNRVDLVRLECTIKFYLMALENLEHAKIKILKEILQTSK